MAPLPGLWHRDICPVGYFYTGRVCRESEWSWWGRWVLAGGIALFVLMVFFAFTCLYARRQRRRGSMPMYGTGWMAPASRYGPPPPYQQYHQQQWQDPQQQKQEPLLHEHGYYSPPVGVGGQAEGVRMPESTHQEGQGQHAPPSGPPPGR